VRKYVTDRATNDASSGFRHGRRASAAALDPAHGRPADAGGAGNLFLRSGRVLAPRLDHAGALLIPTAANSL
jgi:hypothetical protein